MILGTSKFEEFLINNNVPIRSIIIFNSPGGNLYGGMELGRVIRKHQLNTDIGIRRTSKPDAIRYTAGSCYSSCAYAYLGGIFRYLKNGSHYGIHRFYANNPAYGNMDTAQITSAEIVSYVREMGVDPEFFSLSTKAGADEIYEPSQKVLEKLGVVNLGWTRPKWTVESNNGVIYLKGERDTQYGMNKFMMFCNDDKSVMLYIMFDPQGHQEEALAMAAHSLVVDGQDQPIHPFTKAIEGGWFNSMYILKDEELAAIMRAKTVGVIIRPMYETPIFLGFNMMPFEDGASKLVGVVNSCRR